MNDDFKRKNQPIEDQMRESRERMESLICECQVLCFLISIIAMVALVTLVSVSFLLLHYSMNVIYQEIFYGFVVYFSVIGLLVLIYFLYFHRMMKEYDDEPKELKQ